MRAELLPYYEAELRFIREMAREFAKDHPTVASRLQLEPDRCPDPHVERLIQAFALIAGRIRHKIDDEFPEITEALLGVLYPHYVRPIPPMAMAQFQVDPSQGRASTGRLVPRNTTVFTRAIAGTGVACRFRTAFPVTLWPIQLVSAQVLPPAALGFLPGISDCAAVIRLTVECLGETTAVKLGLDSLRIHLHGEGELPYDLYELIMNSTTEVFASTASDDSQRTPFRFPPNSVQAVGFDADEALLPYPDRSFPGYRLLSEYFAFPEKFLFLNLRGFDQLPLAKLGRKFEIDLVLGEFERKERLRRLERLVRADNFQLGCTPVVNLFERVADPIRVTHTETEYRVIPDLHSPISAEVYSVDKVTSVATYGERPRDYQPFYGIRHTYNGDAPHAFWVASRRRSVRKDDPGTEVYLSLVDLDFRPSSAGAEALSVAVTCTNRDLPSRLPRMQDFGDLSLESAAGVRARLISAPTEAARPALRSGLQWRLISHLALNYLSITDGGVDALREILRLYDFADSPIARNQISGVISSCSKPHMTRILTPAGVAFILGTQVRIEFDEERFTGAGVFLFASVLEHFLGLYTSINSFSQLIASTRQRKEVLRKWMPRAGQQVVV